MRLSKFTVGILVSMILLSIFLANLAKVLSTDVHNIPEENSSNFYLRATDTYENLIWFLQVSTEFFYIGNPFNMKY